MFGFPVVSTVSAWKAKMAAHEAAITALGESRLQTSLLPGDMSRSRQPYRVFSSMREMLAAQPRTDTTAVPASNHTSTFGHSPLWEMLAAV